MSLSSKSFLLLSFIFAALLINAPFIDQFFNLKDARPSYKRLTEFVTSELYLRKIYLDYSISVKERVRFRSPTGQLDNTVAMAIPSLNGCTIIFSSMYMEFSTAEIREAVALHEIGHCLGVDHDDTLSDLIFNELGQRCPQSVMHSKDDIATCFFRNRDYYYEELIRKINKS